MTTFRELAEEMCDMSNVDPPRNFSTDRSADPVGRQVLRCFNVAGRWLVGEFMWQELKAEETVALAQGTSVYTLSEDPKRVHGGTIFDNSRNWCAAFPVSEAVWLESKYGNVTAPDRYLLWVAGDQIHVYPTPGASPGTLQLVINSTKWVRGEDSVLKSQLSADDDRIRLNEMMVMLEARWRFLELRQMPYQSAMEQARIHTKRQMNRGGGMSVTGFGAGSADGGVSDPYPENTVSMRG